VTAVSVHNDQWWVTQSGKDPVGPVSTDLVVRGIIAGRVPLDSFVCEVGGPAWKALRDVRAFAVAVASYAAKKVEERPSVRSSRFDPNEERTIVDAEPLLASEYPRPTDRSPPRPLSSRFPSLAQFDGADESTTIADADPIMPSEPALSSAPKTEKDASPAPLTPPKAPKRRLEIVEEMTLTDMEPFFLPE
jgi:hypothetical protein